jgi:hypothetical protein
MKLKTLLATALAVPALMGVGVAQADSLSHASAASAVTAASIPVAVVSGVVVGVAGASGVMSWSLAQISEQLSAWRVEMLTPKGENTAVLLQNTRNAPQRIMVTMATQTVQAKRLAQGQTVEIQKRSTDVAVLQQTNGEPLAVLSSGAAANQHSAARGPR